jgi:hypothetical protein
LVERNKLIKQFLARNNWENTKINLLAADASFRKYFRVIDGKKSVILMDANPRKENVEKFSFISKKLFLLGFSSPRIIASDFKKGLLLIEDFGDITYTKALRSGFDENKLYSLATDALIRLHKKTQGKKIPQVSHYNLAAFEAEHRLLVDWYYPAVKKKNISTSAKKKYLSIWRKLLAKYITLPNVLVLRDYHVDNLMSLSGRRGINSCGLLDFQDAVFGPQVYDLVSLLRDSRRNIRPTLVAKMKKRYLRSFSNINEIEFEENFSVLSAQRNCKVLGIFVRLYMRDRKSEYIRHLPRVWRLLKQNLNHESLYPLKLWFEEYLPEPHRKKNNFRFGKN